MMCFGLCSRPKQEWSRVGRVKSLNPRRGYIKATKRQLDELVRRAAEEAEKRTEARLFYQGYGRSKRSAYTKLPSVHNDMYYEMVRMKRDRDRIENNSKDIRQELTKQLKNTQQSLTAERDSASERVLFLKGERERIEMENARLREVRNKLLQDYEDEKRNTRTTGEALTAEKELKTRAEEELHRIRKERDELQKEIEKEKIKMKEESAKFVESQKKLYDENKSLQEKKNSLEKDLEATTEKLAKRTADEK
eukprot:1343023-Amorphochlora_amoeboformis.AAC.1